MPVNDRNSTWTGTLWNQAMWMRKSLYFDCWQYCNRVVVMTLESARRTQSACEPIDLVVHLGRTCSTSNIRHVRCSGAKVLNLVVSSNLACSVCAYEICTTIEWSWKHKAWDVEWQWSWWLQQLGVVMMVWGFAADVIKEMLVQENKLDDFKSDRYSLRRQDDQCIATASGVTQLCRYLALSRWVLLYE